MGAEQTKLSLTEQYVKSGGLMPQFSEYDNEFEKQIFFAINMVRRNPASFIPYVKAVAYDKDIKKISKTALFSPKACDAVCKVLKNQQALLSVYFDEEANKACKENNLAKIELAEDQPTVGGNAEKFKATLGEDSKTEAEEWTIWGWSNSDAQTIVAMQLLCDFSREEETLKDKSPLLNPNLKNVGISNKAHPKCKNLIQILYVIKTANAME